MQKTRINWPWQPLHTYNPVTGCRRGCTWGKGSCYAKKMWDRFWAKEYGPFTQILMHHNRLWNPGIPKKPAYIFVGSMSDIEYWTPRMIDRVLGVVRNSSQHTFLFLTKNIMAYSGRNWPDNCILGVTMICTQTQHCQQEIMDELSRYPRTFLSIEPIYGTLKASLPLSTQWVIVGCDSSRGVEPPQREWCQSVADRVPANMIHWKQPGIAA